jgi:hypothetical protein
MQKNPDKVLFDLEGIKNIVCLIKGFLNEKRENIKRENIFI